jgi:hypothetical protein
MRTILTKDFDIFRVGDIMTNVTTEYDEESNLTLRVGIVTILGEDVWCCVPSSCCELIVEDEQ